MMLKNLIGVSIIKKVTERVLYQLKKLIQLDLLEDLLD